MKRQQWIVAVLAASIILNGVLTANLVFRPHMSERAFADAMVVRLHTAYYSLHNAQQWASGDAPAVPGQKRTGEEAVFLQEGYGASMYCEGLLAAYAAPQQYSLVNAMVGFDPNLPQVISNGHPSAAQLQPYATALKQALTALRPSLKTGYITAAMADRAAQALVPVSG